MILLSKSSQIRSSDFAAAAVADTTCKVLKPFSMLGQAVTWAAWPQRSKRERNKHSYCRRSPIFTHLATQSTWNFFPFSTWNVPEPINSPHFVHVKVRLWHCWQILLSSKLTVNVRQHCSHHHTVIDVVFSCQRDGAATADKVLFVPIWVFRH